LSSPLKHHWRAERHGAGDRVGLIVVGDSERRASTRGITAGSGKQACKLSVIEKIAVFAGEPAGTGWPGRSRLAGRRGQGILPAEAAM